MLSATLNTQTNTVAMKHRLPTAIFLLALTLFSSGSASAQTYKDDACGRITQLTHPGRKTTTLT